MKKMIAILATSIALSWIIPFIYDYLILFLPTQGVEWVPTIWTWVISLGLTLTFVSAVSISLILAKPPQSSPTSASSKLERLVEVEPSEPYTEKMPSDHSGRFLDRDSSQGDSPGENGTYLISPSEEMSGSPSRYETPDSPPREKTATTPTNAFRMMACPFCGKPISSTVSACPFCHNLIKK